VSGRFWMSFLLALLATLAGLSAIGLASYAIVQRPSDKFVASFFEFTLPKGWSCALEGTEYVCSVGPAPHAAIVILAMKYRNSNDSRAKYIEHLKQPQEITDKDGKVLHSEVRFVEEQQIAGYNWIVSLHYQSELPNFYTQYMATVTSHVGVLITFSAHKDAYDRYTVEFDGMMQSLVVYQGQLAMLLEPLGRF